jgi:hypothetical protein
MMSGHQASERRRAQRFRLAGIVELDVARGTTHNVSRTGAYFETGGRIDPESCLELTLVLKDSRDDDPIRIACQVEVVRVEPLVPDRWGVAVAFSGYGFELTPWPDKQCRGVDERRLPA